MRRLREATVGGIDVEDVDQRVLRVECEELAAGGVDEHLARRDGVVRDHLFAGRAVFGERPQVDADDARDVEEPA